MLTPPTSKHSFCAQRRQSAHVRPVWWKIVFRTMKQRILSCCKLVQSFRLRCVCVCVLFHWFRFIVWCWWNTFTKSYRSRHEDRPVDGLQSHRLWVPHGLQARAKHKTQQHCQPPPSATCPWPAYECVCVCVWDKNVLLCQSFCVFYCGAIQ